MFFLSREALKYMREGATIINTTSVTAYQGHKTLINYASTKGAIVSFTRSLAQVLAKKHVRVNAVAPGPVWTPLIPSSFSEERYRMQMIFSSSKAGAAHPWKSLLGASCDHLWTFGASA